MACLPPSLSSHSHRLLHSARTSSHRITCQYHFNLVSWTFFEISPTFIEPPFIVLLILSFLILSAFLTLYIHHSICISATSNLFSCYLFTAHLSASYTSVGLTTILYSAHFPLKCGISLLFFCPAKLLCPLLPQPSFNYFFSNHHGMRYHIDA